MTKNFFSLQLASFETRVLMLVQAVLSFFLVKSYFPQMCQSQEAMWTLIVDIAMVYALCLILDFCTGVVFHPNFLLLLHAMMNLSLVVYCRYLDLYQYYDIEYLRKPAKTIILCFVTFAVMFFISYVNMDFSSIFLLAGALAGPFAFFLARITNGQYNGAYNFLFHRIMPSEICRISIICALIYILNCCREKNKLWKTIALFLYLMGLAGICALCNEFGTLMLSLLTCFFVCLVNDEIRPIIVGFFLCALGLIGIVLASSEKAFARFTILLAPIGSIFSSDPYIRSEARILKRFITSLSYTSWFGTQFKIPKTQCPPHPDSDYIFQQIILDYGYLLAIAVAVGLIVLIFYLYSMMMPNQTGRTLVESVCFLLLCNTLCLLGGNMYVFPLSGLSLPVLTLGAESQTNIVFFALLAWVCGKAYIAQED